MLHQISLDTLSLFLRIVSIFTGALLVYWEAKSVSDNAPMGAEARENWEKQGPWSDMRSPWRVDRYPASYMLFGLSYFGLLIRPEIWAIVGVALIASAILSPSGYGFATPYLLAATFLRLAIFRLMDFAPNKHKFLVGNKTFELIGQSGILTKGVTPSDQGLVRMEKPIFKNDVMDCIADETINAGEEVKVLEVDCGLLKVARAGTYGTQNQGTR